MKIKTADLIGPALDWAVAKCEGVNAEAFRLYYEPTEITDYDSHGYPEFHYSEVWSQGGPIIEREMINVKSNLARMREHPEYNWLSDCPEKRICVSFSGPTPLVAAMRCYVASKLGDKVDVPEGLMK